MQLLKKLNPIFKIPGGMTQPICVDLVGIFSLQTNEKTRYV